MSLLLRRGLLALQVILGAAVLPAISKADETLLQTVGFALTGHDNAKPTILDEKNCIFSIGNETFHLNNVDLDRILVRKFVRKNSEGKTEPFVEIELHGESTVYENSWNTGVTEQEAATIFGADKAQEEKARSPDLFEQHPHHESSNEHTLSLTSGESDRIQRAWHYIYSHGCKGSKSPF